MQFLLAACSTLMLSTALALPTFPLDWTADELQTIALNQGGVDKGDEVCCEKGSNCKVQLAVGGGTIHFDYTHNRTRSDNGDGTAIISLFGKVGKEFQVDANMTCQSFCPLQFDDLSPFGVDDTAQSIGDITVDGKTYTGYQWKEYILPKLHLGVMEVLTLYVDESGKTAVPFMQVEDLTPLGQHLGQENTTWANFQAGTPDPKLFDFDYKDCPRSPNCNQDNLRKARRKLRFFKTLVFHGDNE